MRNYYFTILLGIFSFCVSWAQPQYDDEVYYLTGANFIEPPNSNKINLTNVPDRTIEFWFYAESTDNGSKQVIYEEGGGLRGFDIFLENDYLVAGAYNNRDYTPRWHGSWIRKPVQARTWYYVVLRLNNAIDTNDASGTPEENGRDKLVMSLYSADDSNYAALQHWSTYGYRLRSHSGNIRLGSSGGNQVYPAAAGWGLDATSPAGNPAYGNIEINFMREQINADHYFTGRIWHFRAWRRALSDAELLNEIATPTVYTSVLDDPDLLAVLNESAGSMETQGSSGVDVTDNEEDTGNPNSFFEYINGVDWNLPSAWVNNLTLHTQSNFPVVLVPHNSTLVLDPALIPGNRIDLSTLILKGNLEVKAGFRLHVDNLVVENAQNLIIEDQALVNINVKADIHGNSFVDGFLWTVDTDIDGLVEIGGSGELRASGAVRISPYPGDPAQNNLVIRNQGSFMQGLSSSLDVSAVPNILVERGKDWDQSYLYSYFSNPIKSSSQDISTIFSNTRMQYVFFYDESTQAWVNQQTGLMTPWLGYAATAPNDAASGTVELRQFVGHDLFNYDFGFATYNIPATGEYALLGNSFTSPMDWQALAADNVGVLNGTCWVWRQTIAASNNQNDEGNYFAFNGTGTNSPQWDYLIPSTIGFFVESVSALPTTINIDNRYRASKWQGASLGIFPNPMLKKSEQEAQKVWLELKNTEKDAHVLIAFDTRSTDGYESYFDGKVFDSPGTQIFAIQDDLQLAIQGNGELEEEKIVPIGVRTIVGEASIAVVKSESFEDIELLLHDKLMGIMHDLQASAFVFTADSDELDESRFELIFSKKVSLDMEEQIIDMPELRAIADAEGLILYGMGSDEVQEISLYDISGKRIEVELHPESERSCRLQVQDLAKGNYLMRLKSKKFYTITKKINY